MRTAISLGSVMALAGSQAHFDYLREIARHYAGPVVIADDLDGY